MSHKNKIPLNKSGAVSLVIARHSGDAVIKQHFFFANINKRKAVWWLDISDLAVRSPRFSEFGLLLFDEQSQKLHHLVVPSRLFITNNSKFARKIKRNGDSVISLELSVDKSALFRDIRPTAFGFDFSRYLHCTINVAKENVLLISKKSGAYQKQRRNQRKEDLIKVKGGGCIKCRYAKSASALVFHHRDEKLKEFNVSGQNLNKHSWEVLLKEADKCDLLCANCHAETHDEEGWPHENGRKTKKLPRVT